MGIEYHEGQPAVDVKDRSTYWQLSDVARAAIEALGENRANAIYDGIVQDFWEVYAPEIARTYGYGAIYSEGRSGGWLVVENAPDLTACNPCYGDALDNGKCDDCIHWEAFAAEIDALVESCSQEYPMRLLETVANIEAEQAESQAMAARDIVTVEA